MGYVKANRIGLTSIFAAVLGVALAGATLLSPAATNVAQAQSEPATAANGVLLPPLEFDPAAARIEDLAESTVASEAATAPVADASTATEAPEAAVDAPAATADDPEAGADAPADGSATTTSLGGSDVAVSSVGGSYEVDRPKKRSERKK
jgi:hypothetical protein